MSAHTTALHYHTTTRLRPPAGHANLPRSAVPDPVSLAPIAGWKQVQHEQQQQQQQRRQYARRTWVIASPEKPSLLMVEGPWAAEGATR